MDINYFASGVKGDLDPPREVPGSPNPLATLYRGGPNLGGQNSLGHRYMKDQPIFRSHQKPIYDLIERVSIECRETKTKVITLANQKERR